MTDVIPAGSRATLADAGALRHALLTGFASATSVTLDTADLAEVDLSYIQLVQAARVHAGEAGIDFHLSTPATGMIADLLDRGGFLTCPTPADLTFWFHGDLTQ